MRGISDKSSSLQLHVLGQLSGSGRDSEILSQWDLQLDFGKCCVYTAGYSCRALQIETAAVLQTGRDEGGSLLLASYLLHL